MARDPSGAAGDRGFHAFDVCLPSPVLTAIGEAAYQAVRIPGATGQALDVVAAAESELRRRLDECGVPVVEGGGGDSTWRVAMRLERVNDGGAQISAAFDAWDTREGGDMTAHESQHRAWAREWLGDHRSPLRISEARVRRLALVAAFSPATCVLRAVQSVFPDEGDAEPVKRVASLCLGPMRRYFNRPHVQQIIRHHRFRIPWRQLADDDRNYTERVLVYAGDANLQAVLDEYLYLLRHATQGETVKDAVRQLEEVWTLSRGTPRTNGAKGRGGDVLIASGMAAAAE